MALAELKLQMTTATFNTWLADSQLLKFDEPAGKYVIGVRNDYAQDWLQHRLHDTIARALQAVTGRENVKLLFVRNPNRTPVAPDQPSEDAGPPPFPGFEPYQSNFTQTPRQYFEIVLPAGPPVVAAFVGAVIHHTYGEIINYHTSERAEWWEASFPEYMAASGLASVNSLRKAIRLALDLGYVVREPGRTHKWKFRLRRFGESYPQEGRKPVDKGIKK